MNLNKHKWMLPLSLATLVLIHQRLLGHKFDINQIHHEGTFLFLIGIVIGYMWSKLDNTTLI